MEDLLVDLLFQVKEQNSLLAEMNKNLEQIASKEQLFREAKTKTLPSAFSCKEKL